LAGTGRAYRRPPPDPFELCAHLAQPSVRSSPCRASREQAGRTGRWDRHRQIDAALPGAGRLCQNSLWEPLEPCQ